MFQHFPSKKQALAFLSINFFIKLVLIISKDWLVLVATTRGCLFAMNNFGRDWDFLLFFASLQTPEKKHFLSRCFNSSFSYALVVVEVVVVVVGGVELGSGVDPTSTLKSHPCPNWKHNLRQSLGLNWLVGGFVVVVLK